MSPVTLRDVANRAGVSSKTVSRVLNDEPNVANATRRKVEQAIAELNYVPNAFARRLSSGHAKAIGVTLGWPVYSPYISKLIESAFRESYLNGYNFSLFSLADVGVDHIIAAYLGRQVDGFILDTPSSMNSELINELNDLDAPCVVVNPNTRAGFKYASFVSINDREATMQSTRYLIELGHRQIGYVAAQTEIKHQMDRIQGYRFALEEAGIPFREELVRTGKGLPVHELGIILGKELLENFPEVSAIMANTDDIAMGVMKTIWQQGLRIPDDISVVGFDDNYYTPLITPPLTTIRQPIEQLASTAVRLLIQQINDPGSKLVDLIIPTQLVIRDSCISPRDRT